MKTRVLLTEFYPTRGHQVLFRNTARILSINFDVTCLVSKDSYIENADRMPFPYYQKKQYYIYDLYASICYCQSVAKYIIDYARKYNFDKVIILSFYDIGLFFSRNILPNNLTFFLMHHYNVDLFCSSKLRRFLFGFYKKKFKHIVQCSFMKKVMVKTVNIDSSDVIVWPHPLNTIDKMSEIEDIDCSGLSTSNDEEVIAEIIEMERNTSILKRENLHVYIKSRKHSFNDGNLIIINGFLDKDVFDDIIDRSKALFLPFPPSFKTRMSGTLMDALSNEKFVIGTRIPVVENSRKSYPLLVKVYDTASFVEQLKLLRKGEKETSQFQNFKKYHCDEYLSEIMKNSINGHVNSNTIDF